MGSPLGGWRLEMGSPLGGWRLEMGSPLGGWRWGHRWEVADKRPAQIAVVVVAMPAIEALGIITGSNYNA